MRATGLLILSLLALVLAPLGEGLRHPAMASGRSSGWMELCSDLGPVKVAMAADGSIIPTDPAQPSDQPDAPQTRHCPDCLPLPLPVTAGGAALLSLRVAGTPRRLDRALPQTRLAGHDRPRPSARAPPMVI